jgi:hypothetical protein
VDERPTLDLLSRHLHGLTLQSAAQLFSEFRNHPAFKTVLKIFFKEVARGGEQTWVLSISFIFLIFTTLPLSHSGSPFLKLLRLHNKGK